MWNFFEAFTTRIHSLRADDIVNLYKEKNIDSAIKVKDFETIEKNDARGSFDNKQNHYLKIIQYFKRFVDEDETDILNFIYESILNVKVQQNNKKSYALLSDFLGRMQCWRRFYPEYQTIISLIVMNDKKLIRIYLKMRSLILKYSKENFKAQYLSVSNHNLNKFVKQNYDMHEIFIGMDTWSVLLSKIFEGTNYISKSNIDKMIDFVREFLKSQDTIDVNLKIQATKFIEIALYLFNFRKQLFPLEIELVSKKQNPQQFLTSSNKVYQTADNRYDSSFVENLVNSQRLKLSNVRPRKPQIEDIMINQKNNTLKKAIDYTYRLNTIKQTESLTKSLESKLKTKKIKEMTQIQKQKDPIVEDIRKFMNQYKKNSKSSKAIRI